MARLRDRKLRIRLATLKDLKEIVSIYNTAISAGHQTADIELVTAESRIEWFNSHSNERHPIFVTEQENVVVGYLTISPYRPGRGALKNTAEVSFYLSKDYQRQGIGTKLLQHAFVFCRSVNIKSIFAIVIDTNLPSISFLKSNGFSKWGHLPKIAEFDGI